MEKSVLQFFWMRSHGQRRRETLFSSTCSKVLNPLSGSTPSGGGGWKSISFHWQQWGSGWRSCRVICYIFQRKKKVWLYLLIYYHSKKIFFLSKWDNKFWKNTCLVCVVCWEKKIIFLKYATIKFEYTKILRNEDKRKLKEKWEV